ncbi:hypothetical protein ACFL2S_16710 [Thermodesulfobacteriota bacterium]
MSELNAAIDRKSDDKNPSVWEYMIYASLAIVAVIAVSISVFDLFSERSEYFETENVAIETYKSYSQRLNAISEKYAKEMETIEKVN